ncbi:chorismate-binding protein [Geodermatophilus sp. SYSU D01176]
MQPHRPDGRAGHRRPFGLHRALALEQRGAHNAYLDLGRFVVASASPELLFENRGDRVRNDVARVAEVGSVTVPALFTVERHGTVLQPTSEVTPRLRPGAGLADLFRALFPCGSVTGAPKASSMAVPRTLEDTPRGVYCGAIGLVGPPDAPVRARFSVAIRTAVVDTASGAAVHGTGGGITWSSEAAAEHAEVPAEAAVLSCRPEEFELLETTRYEPDSGLRNEDGHLRRPAGSAEHLGFALDLPAAVRHLRTRLAGWTPPQDSGCAPGGWNGCWTWACSGGACSPWRTCSPRRRSPS